jgi:uncharacterized protein with HEPN domain
VIAYYVKQCPYESAASGTSPGVSATHRCSNRSCFGLHRHDGLRRLRKGCAYTGRRTIEIIGEAAHKVRTADPAFAAWHSEIPWELMYGMRNRIVHDYFEIDLEVVWQTVQKDLPVLRKQIEPLLNQQ